GGARLGGGPGRGQRLPALPRHSPARHRSPPQSHGARRADSPPYPGGRSFLPAAVQPRHDGAGAAAAVTALPALRNSTIPPELPMIRLSALFIGAGGTIMSRKLVVRAALAIVAALVPAAGCTSTPGNPFGLFPPEGHKLLESTKMARRAAPDPVPLPRELDKRTTPPYLIEPGDTLLVQPANFDSPARLPG